jgi:ABC-2 type transport system ATP-binding protein
MSENLIEVSGLTKKFGNFTAVNAISFNIKKGEILGFLGPNGAGKTTTIKMIIGLLNITAGKVLISGLDAQKHRRNIKRIMGYMSQKFSLYPLLNALENIEFFAGISGLPLVEIKKKQRSIQKEIDISILKQRVMDIPPGIKQKISLYVCLMTDPEIIFLDEPTSGVDPEVRRNFWLEIYKLKSRGKTILVSTHNLDEVEYSDRLLIIHKGDIVLEGEPQELLQFHQKESIEILFKETIINNEKAINNSKP